MRQTPALHQPPVPFKLILVKLRPRLNKPPLPAWKGAGQRLQRVNGVDDDAVLVVGMEVGTVVRPASLHVHPDDDAEEPWDFGHRLASPDCI